MSRSSNIREKISQEDVTVARSYLEVDFMRWLSQNKIPYGYEAFTIPSVIGPTQREWSRMVDAIRSVGRGDFDEYDEITEDTRWEETRPAEVLDMWNEIYDKHRLQSEDVVVEVRRSLSEFDKQLILPDYALYPNVDFKVAPESFDWSSWEYIVEVSGLWGVGLPEESTESDWWTWYRVSGVAFKEFVYKLLGLWEDVYWVIPNQSYDPDTGSGIPKSIRNDDHYIIFNSTSADFNLDELEDILGITTGAISAGLSPDIELIEYGRPARREFPSDFNIVEWEYGDVNVENIDQDPNAVSLSEDFIVYHGNMGEVYITDESVHVRESQWTRQNMIMLREYVLDVVGKLEEAGIVSGVRRVE